jgi:hypothetical protein
LQGDKSDLISGGNPAEWSAVGDVWGGLSENMEISTHPGEEQPFILGSSTTSSLEFRRIAIPRAWACRDPSFSNIFLFELKNIQMFENPTKVSHLKAMDSPTSESP